MYQLCNEVGCQTAMVCIDIRCTDITIFNGFSPDHDGMNDAFVVDGIDLYPNNILTIYNRWGNKVYEQHGYANDWVGTFDDKPLPDGTYFYVLDLNDGFGSPIYTGYVQIHR